MNLNPIFKKIDDIKLELDKLKDDIKSDPVLLLDSI